jgi:TrkA-N domain/RyR domain
MEFGVEKLLPPGREGRLWRWATVILALASFSLSCIAFSLSPAVVATRWVAFMEALYESAQLLILHLPRNEVPEGGPVELFYLARAFAMLAWAAFGIWAISFILSREWRRWRIVRWHHPVVICGLSGAGLELVTQCRQRGEKVVAIDEEPEIAAAVRAEEAGASLLSGRPDDLQWLRKAGVHRAKYVLAATRNDSANIAAVVRASQISAVGRRTFVHIADPQLRAQLRRQRTFRSDGPTPATIFNVFDHSARLLLRDHPLDHTRVRPQTPQAVQIVVIGFGLMGEAVLTRAALTGHYGNLKPLQAIVIDRDADRKKRLFRGRYPQFDRVAELSFFKLDAQEPATQAQIAGMCGDAARTISTVVIAFNDPPSGYSIALSLAERLGTRVPIRLRLDDDSGLGVLLERQGDGGSPAGPIRAFGSLREACAPQGWLDSDLDVMANALHKDYVNRLPAAERTRPDNRSAYPWERLDDDLVESNRQLADHIPVKLRAVGCHTAVRGDASDPGRLVQEFEKDEVELLARMEHKRWMAERFLAGWTLGPKDVERRVSPYLVEWEALPSDIQEYDRNFVRILPGVLGLVNREIRR